jgi:hypothetical protein
MIVELPLYAVLYTGLRGKENAIGKRQKSLEAQRHVFVSNLKPKFTSCH